MGDDKYTNRHITWKGFSSKERNIAIHEIEQIINIYADIIDFRFFSDMDVTLKIEISERKISDLYNKLGTYLNLDHFQFETTNSDREFIIHLQLTFANATGNLTHTVPSVPG